MSKEKLSGPSAHRIASGLSVEIDGEIVSQGQNTLLELVLDAAIVITGADMGAIQLLDRERQMLTLAASNGFDAPLLDYFANVDHQDNTACSAALTKRERIVVEDVAESDMFDGPALDVMLAAEARALQSTPLVSSSGQVWGMLSTHWRAPQQTFRYELAALDRLARRLADHLEHTDTGGRPDGA